MSVYFDKFVSGLKESPAQTAVRTCRFFGRRIRKIYENAVCALMVPLLAMMPTRSRVKLKSRLNILVRLDYPRRDIRLCAESEISLRRSLACLKEPETVVWLEKSIRKNDVLFDIGANVGAYSLIAAKQAADDVQVYSFEPSFSTYEQLCRNVILNNLQDKISPYLLAVMDKTGLVDFEYRSLVGGAAEHIVALNDGNAPDFDPIYVQRLIGVSLDDLIGKFGLPIPTLIKLDVDGAEEAILAGAENLLKSSSLRSVLVEVRVSGGQAAHVQSVLEAAGFTLEEKYDRGNGEIWNYIFVRAGA